MTKTTKTTSFRLEGERTECPRCGSLSIMAHIDHRSLCLACSSGWKDERICHICKCMGIPCDVGPEAECQGCYDGTHSFMICQTKRQHGANLMLSMRRAMKFLAIAIRLERFDKWMDSKIEGEMPDLEPGDTEAFLLAEGFTKEGLKKSELEVLAMVNEAMERINDD